MLQEIMKTQNKYDVLVINTFNVQGDIDISLS